MRRRTAHRKRFVDAMLVVLLIAGGAVPAQAQREPGKTDNEIVEPTFLVDAISFAALTAPQSRLDIFVQVGYDNLSFVKNADGYDASFEMTISIYDSVNTLVVEKLWTEQVKGVSFDQSVSPSMYSLTQRVFMVTPGKYLISVIMRDNETKVPKRLLRQLVVLDFFREPFALSDIMLVSRIAQKGEKRSIVPSISSNMGDVSDAFYTYFEAYNTQHIDSVLFVAIIMNEKGENVQQADTGVRLRDGRNEVLMRIDHSRLSLGDYTIHIKAFRLPLPAPAEQRFIGVTNRKFSIRWHGVPKSVKDIDIAIEQLRYIAKDREFDRLKEGKTLEEKQKRFLEFWKSRDPNPNTPRNEKMEEFYSRVEYSTKHFSHYQEGWRTDRGMVYIIFGPPNNVDRHPFETDSKPYEVWSYYDLNHQFVFLDETGFGDYRLTTPIWEVWQRPRN
jgi:GWxTD domain-containing protein